MDKAFHARRGIKQLICLGMLLAIAMLLVACEGGTPLPAPATAVPPTSRPQPSPTPIDDFVPQGAVTVTPVPSPIGLNEDARVGVYVAVIEGILDKEEKEVRYVYIGPYIGQGEHLDNPDEDTPIPSKLLSTLKRTDASGRRVYEARDFSEVVGAIEEGTPSSDGGEGGTVGGEVKHGGVLITLGPILNQQGKKDAVDVRASVYRNVNSAEGNIYSLSRDSSARNGWKLVTVSPEWSSNDAP